MKFGFPMAFTATMLGWSVAEFGGLMAEEDRREALVALRWATDYLLKTVAHPNRIYVQVFFRSFSMSPTSLSLSLSLILFPALSSFALSLSPISCTWLSVSHSVSLSFVFLFLTLCDSLSIFRLFFLFLSLRDRYSLSLLRIFSLSV